MMEIEEKAPLLESKRSGVLSRSSQGYKVLKTVGTGAKGFLGLQGNASDDGKTHFTSSIGAVLSMLGAVVGTGNIWRFPRIMATHAEEGGALVFLIVWVLFLFIWSIPICLIEYGVGRYTGRSTVESFAKILGPSYRWFGGFMTGTVLMQAGFYSVLVGYCFYYACFFMVKELPSELEVAESHFDKLLDSHWPVVFHLICIVLACLAISKGVSTIEPVNRIIVPTLLAIVVFSFYWSLYLPYAGMGIIHMFKPNWKSFTNAQLWRDALVQNAWDTGAGGGSLLTYASYLTRRQGAVKLGATIPFVNNFISLLCGMTTFANVFSFEYLKGSSITVIVDVLKTNGPYNTGITFIQMPLLYGTLTGGRALAILFFLCVTLAGLSSLISIQEQCVHVMEDFGVRRLVANLIVSVLIGGLGVASALSNTVFVNQDTVWAQAQIVSGCLLIFMVIRYGVFRFRKDIYNNYGIGDWPLPLIWVFVILFICPIEGVGMFIWSVAEDIVNNTDPYYPNHPWWEFTETSFLMTFTQWTVLICIMVGLNWWLKPITRVLPPARPNSPTAGSDGEDTPVTPPAKEKLTKFAAFKQLLLKLLIREESQTMTSPPSEQQEQSEEIIISGKADPEQSSSL